MLSIRWPARPTIFPCHSVSRLDFATSQDNVCWPHSQTHTHTITHVWHGRRRVWKQSGAPFWLARPLSPAPPWTRRGGPERLSCRWPARLTFQPFLSSRAVSPREVGSHGKISVRDHSADWGKPFAPASASDASSTGREGLWHVRSGSRVCGQRNAVLCVLGPCQCGWPPMGGPNGPETWSCMGKVSTRTASCVCSFSSCVCVYVCPPVCGVSPCV